MIVKIETYYLCEICGRGCRDAAEAIACESRGFPEPMPFIPIGEKIPAFGEDGIEHATIESVLLQSDNGRHGWAVVLDRPLALNHNRGEAWIVVPVSDFDPRHGTDAFRYGATAEEIQIWEETLRRYGFTEADASDFVLGNIQKARELNRSLR